MTKRSGAQKRKKRRAKRQEQQRIEEKSAQRAPVGTHIPIQLPLPTAPTAATTTHSSPNSSTQSPPFDLGLLPSVVSQRMTGDHLAVSWNLPDVPTNSGISELDEPSDLTHFSPVISAPRPTSPSTMFGPVENSRERPMSPVGVVVHVPSYQPLPRSSPVYPTPIGSSNADATLGDSLFPRAPFESSLHPWSEPKDPFDFSFDTPQAEVVDGVWPSAVAVEYIPPPELICPSDPNGEYIDFGSHQWWESTIPQVEVRYANEEDCQHKQDKYDFSDPLQALGVHSGIESIHVGPWLELHRNFASYVLQTLGSQHHGLATELVLLTQKWSKCDMLTSLANHHSVMEILFKYLKAAVKANATARSKRRQRDTRASETADQLCRDFPSILEHVTSTLRDPEGRQQFFARRGALAQGLLDLLQDLLDSSYDFLPATRSLLCKALLRLSRKSGLHPTCFILPGLKKMGHQLAGGGYGDIWKGLVDGQTVAVKSMRIFLEDDVKVALKEFGREALIWRQLSHPNLLPFFGLYTLDGRLCLVSPWMANGHLQQFLKNAPPNIDRVSLMLDVAMGLEYLHCKNVVHGDLKAPNILVTPSGRACIADFGLSSIIDAMAFQFTQSTESMRGGTARYQAPEVLEGTSPNHVGSDVYAFACVCYQILTGQLPFFELPNEIKIGIKVIGGYRPSRPEDMKFPDDLWTLLEECWVQASERRPKMPKIVHRLSGFPTSRRVSQLADWDDTCSARFRRAAQKWPPLLPTAAAIDKHLLSDASPLPVDSGQWFAPDVGTRRSHTVHGIASRRLRAWQ